MFLIIIYYELAKLDLDLANLGFSKLSKFKSKFKSKLDSSRTWNCLTLLTIVSFI